MQHTFVVLVSLVLHLIVSQPRLTQPLPAEHFHSASVFLRPFSILNLAAPFTVKWARDVAVHLWLTLRYDFPLNDSSHRYHAQHIISISVAVSLKTASCMQLDRYFAAVHQGIWCHTTNSSVRPLAATRHAFAARCTTTLGHGMVRRSERPVRAERERRGDQAHESLGPALAPSNIP